jgi:transcriptional regulator GlxA family with amidase domain
MGHARTLLLTTERPLDEVAAAVGYGSVPAFVNAFRAFYGVTPARQRLSRIWLMTPP